MGGNVAIKDGDRTLVIQSVTREGDQWIADGRFGITGNNLGKVDIKVTTSENGVTIEFTSRASAPAKLKLEGDNELNGTLNVHGRRPGQLVDAQIKLKKVE
jgi:hypothetical protein